MRKYDYIVRDIVDGKAITTEHYKDPQSAYSDALKIIPSYGWVQIFDQALEEIIKNRYVILWQSEARTVAITYGRTPEWMRGVK